jgi:hypothetical protein
MYLLFVLTITNIQEYETLILYHVDLTAVLIICRIVSLQHIELTNLQFLLVSSHSLKHLKESRHYKFFPELLLMKDFWLLVCLCQMLETYSAVSNVRVEISGSHSDEYEDGCLLGYCAK